ncbi:MAG: peptide-methionine (R)-S-oxide reductase MsrB [Pseudomonadota bacterium]
MVEKVVRSDAEWREILTSEAYRVLRRKGTERAFTHDNFPKEPGKYHCAGCGTELFDAAHKFESGTGWPSFFQPAHEMAVEEHEDRSWFMTRTEIVCARCDGHLGHVFSDGPRPTGLRYCMNGVALSFEPEG